MDCRQKELKIMVLRRIGTPTSKTRSTLLNAAEALMRESGYAAVTSRRVAARAGLKPQLVHYYFRTMDDLFLAMFGRVAAGFFHRQNAILESSEPLKALWELTSDPKGVVLSYEFVALANHRKAIRAEIAEFGNRYREGQVKILAHCLEKSPVGPIPWPPVFSAVVLDSLARTLSLEKALGVSVGHAEVMTTMRGLIGQVDRSLRKMNRKMTSRTQKRPAGK
jgi:TetR/AcrR family transcriptional regulator